VLEAGVELANKLTVTENGQYFAHHQLCLIGTACQAVVVRAPQRLRDILRKTRKTLQYLSKAVEGYADLGALAGFLSIANHSL